MNFPASKRIIARDISWLAFNERVLQEALDSENNPLIERLRFLGIFSSNMDEFFRVRYASMKRLAQMTDQKQERLGALEPEQVLMEISEKVQVMQARSQEINDQLMQELSEHDIEIVNEKELTAGQQEYVRKFFIEKVSPTVFTLMLGQSQELPELRDKSIYLAIRMYVKQNPDEPRFALIEVPSEQVGRFVSLPRYGKQYVMYLEDVIRYNLEYILFIYNIDRIEAHTVKITRDAELDLDDDVSKSFLEKMTRSVKNRRSGDPVRFVYDKEIAEETLQYLVGEMDLDSYDSLIAGGRYHNKKDLIKFPNIGDKELEFESLPQLAHPDLDMDRSILEVLDTKDVLLFLPYHNFSYIIRTLREAAIDPEVRSIDITLYRMASDSRVISALVNAAKNGKEVTAVIELQARFDEANNIQWTEVLQSEGVNVIFGVQGLKVHSKVILITKEVEGREQLYASVGTGNFNESTSKLYTDYHLLTADKRITKDVARVFDFLRNNYKVKKYRHLLVSPHDTRRGFIKLIEKEIENAKKGLSSGIKMKLNSLSDVKLIDKLYEASAYGVQVQMVIRGICSLVPGQKGMSENIEAISILDRYLEHSRLIIFENGGDPKYFLGSADWMPRNLDYRVEVTTPVYDEKVKRQLRDHFEIIWKDNVKSRWHNAELNNEYRQIRGPKIRSQYAMHDYVKKQLKLGK
ncbi:polyphosphate kinase 1 [Croceimicrobium hydrocarbonivorans]|uniref:Polyphosphate kinase n=1 Tax=Croceimicrobium hydrocarbonivorans TaxID=2761580 RepID=A0A7H0VG10_9FLAO|nr:polyphosphate kinase 1 [Croceimicrobium hydrocarbonivorans]QNR24658.1 polyphosphate kinase 1 [Croceimicrobium hydrocarbonivorans]